MLARGLALLALTPSAEGRLARPGTQSLSETPLAGFLSLRRKSSLNLTTNCSWSIGNSRFLNKAPFSAETGAGPASPACLPHHGL